MDYSTLSWSEAFEAANAKFSREYAFTEWKGVDFGNLYARFAPRIAAAEAAADTDTYYRTLREYLFSIPDGHIMITSPDQVGLSADEIAGGFGLVAAELDDGRIIAAAVTDGGPAANAGIQVGAELLAWNGVPVDVAVEAVSVLWNKEPPATNENRRMEKIRFLTRAAVGAARTVDFRNPGESEPHSAVMIAIDDHKKGLDLVNFAPSPDMEDVMKLVEYRVLDSGYGYVRVYVESDMDGESEYAWAVYAKFEEAIKYFVELNVPGLIVDLRGNMGGSDETAADLSGFFYREARHYENQFLYNALTGEFMWVFMDEKEGDILPIPKPLEIMPQSVYYGGPVIALVNPACISSGEGIAMGIKGSPNGRVVGFFGTNGSFGITGGTIIMPYTSEFRCGFAYPIGRSLDADFVVQIDSGKDGKGGVFPNNRVPRTLENVLAYANGDDVELQFAIAILQKGS
ncbi:MAG: peptidase S41 [Deltaproteobacteria bacterium]|nr:peptidase S41 [Deltaproteobacteria bacterium]